MEKKLRERFVGALVLVALAVVILPWLLDEDRVQGKFQSRIPPQPDTSDTHTVLLSQPRPLDEAAEPDRPIAAKAAVPELDNETKNVAPQEQIASKPSAPAKQEAVAEKIEAEKAPSMESKPMAESEPPSAHAVVSAAPIPAKTPAEKAGKGFVIQLGLFANQANANALVQKLQQNGYRAYARNDEKDGQAVMRVLVGPYMEQKDATADLPKLQPLSGVTGMVASFDPLKH